ncbi:iron chelate uptake ABC transporter family permease subunit [Paenibacillus brasilensis]|uniref:ABC-type Fe2+-enterobactin transport system substrate-binding protein n=1 Tax=Paenibacillus brasilensis TaxID=128574 RepID=A0ABU0KYE2_9BACL|nr:ABC-type Fe2+-enterobactin transport system substrate-binding protein [Paenibacillus brasilensis]
MLELQPDLIIATEDTTPEVKEQLEKIAPTVVVSFGNGDVFKQLRDVAAVLGKDKEAEQWIASLDKKAEEGRKKLAGKFKKNETVTIYMTNVMNVLNLRDQTASGLGTPIERERILLLAAAVGLASSSVSVSGGIGFVGLVAPHLARKLVGPKHKMLLVTCALAGALLVLVADTITRSLPLQKEIPTGLIVAIIGAPYFLYLRGRSKG